MPLLKQSGRAVWGIRQLAARAAASRIDGLSCSNDIGTCSSSEGIDIRNVRAVCTRLRRVSPADAEAKLEVLPEFTASPDFRKLAIAFKRVKNIARELPDDDFDVAEARIPICEIG